MASSRSSSCLGTTRSLVRLGVLVSVIVPALLLGSSPALAQLEPPPEAFTTPHRSGPSIGGTVPLGACCPAGAITPGELLVVFSAGTSIQRMTEIAEQIGATFKRILAGPVALMGVPACQEHSYRLLFQGFSEVLTSDTSRVGCPDIDPPLPRCECCPPNLICGGGNWCSAPTFDHAPPQVSASLAPAPTCTAQGGPDDDASDDQGLLTVLFGATDACDPLAHVEASLMVPGCEAIPVTTSQAILFECPTGGNPFECEVEQQVDVLEIEGTSVTLLVTATDAAGNTTTAVVRAGPNLCRNAASYVPGLHLDGQFALQGADGPAGQGLPPKRVRFHRR